METTETSEIPATPRARPRRFMSFTTFIWAFVAGAFIVAIVWPVISGEIAMKTWQAVPCRLSPHGDMYFYSFMNQKYYSERLDFWDRFHIESHLVPNDEKESANDGLCYVNPNKPLQSVLYPDAIARIAGAAQRVMALGLLAVAAVLITVKVRRQKGLRHRMSAN